MTYPGGRTLDIWRLTDGTEDAHGNAPRAWAFHHQITDCLVAPPVSLSNPNRYEPASPGREQVNEMFTVLAPPGVDVDAHDQAKLDGKRYEVIGEPGAWRDPWSGEDIGVQFALERREG